jgi:ABC-type Fe2+-enterobactin transport system substrate-binding protein
VRWRRQDEKRMAEVKGIINQWRELATDQAMKKMKNW